MPVILAVLIGVLASAPSAVSANDCVNGQPCGDSCISWEDTCHAGSSGRGVREDNNDVVVVIVGLALAVITIGVVVALALSTKKPASPPITARYTATDAPPPAPSLPPASPPPPPLFDFVY